MKPLDKGTYFYLPILQRSIDKANAIIERFMSKIDAQKITIPNLTPTEFWKDSGMLPMNNSYEIGILDEGRFLSNITFLGRLENHENELLLLHEQNDWPQLLGPVCLLCFS